MIWCNYHKKENTVNVKIAIDKIYILVYTNSERSDFMLKAKIFENGRSQAVRLPKECRFNSDTNEVSVNKIGDIVMLIPMTNQWSSFIQAVNMFSDDFFENGREDSEPQAQKKVRADFISTDPFHSGRDGAI